PIVPRERYAGPTIGSPRFGGDARPAPLNLPPLPSFTSVRGAGRRPRGGPPARGPARAASLNLCPPWDERTRSGGRGGSDGAGGAGLGGPWFALVCYSKEDYNRAEESAMVDAVAREGQVPGIIPIREQEEADPLAEAFGPELARLRDQIRRVAPQDTT